MELGDYWLMLDTLYIAGPFESPKEARDYLEEETDIHGLITVHNESEVCLVPALDVLVEYAPLATLQEIMEHQKTNEE